MTTLAGVLLAAGLAANSAAQTYPIGPIRMVVPFSRA
jgi:tripartite-type tricarboxylate transporter receptor subunit TctC